MANKVIVKKSSFIGLYMTIQLILILLLLYKHNSSILVYVVIEWPLLYVPSTKEEAETKKNHRGNNGKRGYSDEIIVYYIVFLCVSVPARRDYSGTVDTLTKV